MSTKIFWAGDSTVKDNNFTSYPQCGIGQGMRLYINKNIEICNYAENGRSTKSFIDESRLAAIYNEITKGDFLFIQFGHNDEKKEDPNRYTDPWDEYQVNLEKFINVARNKLAYPILITPLSRRKFVDDVKLDAKNHGDYPLAMIEVGKKLNVPVIDLCTTSKEWIEQIGKEESKKYFMHIQPSTYENYPDGLEDDTHLTYEGAVTFARLIAKALKNFEGIYKELLLEPDRL